MKIKQLVRSAAGALSLVALLNLQLTTCLAQGSLTPPGAPAPTMKSLDQIEARTAITNSGAVTISQPGSYYLTTNLTVSSGNGVTITANDVTLDLNGFTIFSTQNPPFVNAYGISLGSSSGVTNVTILNGFIKGDGINSGGTFSGGGFGYGIVYSGGVPYNPHVSRVSVSGCGYGGIFLAQYGSMVESCHVYTVGGSGINAVTVSDSLAEDCASDAITGITANNCTGFSSGGQAGISVTTANNCTGYSPQGGIGVNATTANNCYGSSSTSPGIKAFAAMNCYGVSSSGIGVLATNASFCVGSRTGGTAIQAVVATGCVAAGGTNLIANKYNMP